MKTTLTLLLITSCFTSCDNHKKCIQKEKEYLKTIDSFKVVKHELDSQNVLVDMYIKKVDSMTNVASNLIRKVNIQNNYSDIIIK